MHRCAGLGEGPCVSGETSVASQQGSAEQHRAVNHEIQEHRGCDLQDGIPNLLDLRLGNDLYAHNRNLRC